MRGKKIKMNNDQEPEEASLGKRYFERRRRRRSFFC